MAERPITIAIDGYSSCGKSTIAKAMAAKLGYAYVDSGAMYRAVALYALRNGWADGDTVNGPAIIASLNSIDVHFRPDRATGRADTYLNGENVEDEIRSMAVSSVVSHVSVIREVRAKLRAMQQQMGLRGGVVMDGRDIGTAVFPHAELKIFMTADPEIRAQRRFDELRAQGRDVTFESVRTNLAERDHEDTHRAEDPLRQADDALVLDNSHLTPHGQLALALQWAEQRIGMRNPKMGN
ncbi:MAG: (d)CMP kinase [Flavobacteriales bacterium]|nr:(d)CMP kinase [Flavobacteriales bacterium]